MIKTERLDIYSCAEEKAKQDIYEIKTRVDRINKALASLAKDKGLCNSCDNEEALLEHAQEDILISQDISNSIEDFELDSQFVDKSLFHSQTTHDYYGDSRIVTAAERLVKFARTFELFAQEVEEEWCNSHYETIIKIIEELVSVSDDFRYQHSDKGRVNLTSMREDWLKLERDYYRKHSEKMQNALSTLKDDFRILEINSTAYLFLFNGLSLSLNETLDAHKTLLNRFYDSLELVPKLEEFGIPNRIINILTNEGITSIKMLALKSRRELEDVSGIGEKSLSDIREAFLNKNLPSLIDATWNFSKNIFGERNLKQAIREREEGNIVEVTINSYKNRQRQMTYAMLPQMVIGNTPMKIKRFKCGYGYYTIAELELERLENMKQDK